MGTCVPIDLTKPIFPFVDKTYDRRFNSMDCYPFGFIIHIFDVVLGQFHSLAMTQSLEIDKVIRFTKQSGVKPVCNFLQVHLFLLSVRTPNL